MKKKLTQLLKFKLEKETFYAWFILLPSLLLPTLCALELNTNTQHNAAQPRRTQQNTAEHSRTQRKDTAQIFTKCKMSMRKKKSTRKTPKIAAVMHFCGGMSVTGSSNLEISTRNHSAQVSCADDKLQKAPQSPPWTIFSLLR